MHILIVTATYLPTVNGVAISLARQKKELEKRGHSITLFAPKHTNHINEKGVIRLPSVYNPVYPDYPILLPIPTIHNLQVLKQKFDLIYFHHPFYVGDLALNLAKYYKCPAVFFYHSRYEKGARLHFSKFIPNFLITYLVDKSVRRVANQSNGIIVETSSIERTLKKQKITTPISVIPSVGKRMLAKVPKSELRKKYGLNLKNIIILSVVRLSKEKNLFSLLKIFSRFKNRQTVTFLLVGDGPIKKDLLKFANKVKILPQLRLMGSVSYERLAEIYSLADIFVHPGRLETQAIVILEAMSAGLPMVAFNNPGPKDFIKEGISGFLAENNRDFFKKVESLVKDANLRRKIGESALLTSSKYSYKKSVDQLEDLFKELTK